MPVVKQSEHGMMLLAIDLEGQIQHGRFEHALCHLIDHELDLCLLPGRFKNDVCGAPAYDPAALRKIVVLAYSRGIISTRRIAEASNQTVRSLWCRETAIPTSPSSPGSEPTLVMKLLSYFRKSCWSVLGWASWIKTLRQGWCSARPAPRSPAAVPALTSSVRRG